MTHHILDLLRSALVHYGYWAVAAALLLESAGLPLPGETVLLLASFLAYSEQELRFPWIIAVGIVATTLGGEFGFALGRHGGRPLIERYRHVFAIRAATVNAGELMGWQDRVGAIETGKFADLIAVQGDPLSDITVLQQVKFVMKEGTVVKNQLAVH